MTDSSPSPQKPLNKPHFQDPKPPKKSKLLFLFSKSLIIVFVLGVFTYFPSQVPQYFNKTSFSTIVTKLWDLIYLLVIGIAVCYGLFSSRKLDNLDSSDDSVKETYLSGISDISSIFDNGVQGLYGFEEKGFVGQLDKVKTGKRSTPLGLPVRNLVSKSVDSGGVNLVVDSDWEEVKKGKFRGLVPIKLEDKFKESVLEECDSRRVVHWRSKSMRLDKREDMCTSEVSGSSHVRGYSVEVGDFEGLKSRSMRFSVMKNSNHGYMQQPKFGIGGSSEMNNRLGSKDVFDDFGKIDGTLDKSTKECLKGCVKTEVIDSALDSNNNVPFIKPKSQRSNGILKDFGTNNVNGTLNGSSKEFLKPVRKTKVDDGIKLYSNNDAPIIKSKNQRSSLGAPSEMNLETFDYVLGKEDKADRIDVIPKPAPNANTYKRGKSVRTNRQKEQVLETKVKTFPSNDKVETRMELGANATDVNPDQYLSDTEPYSSEVDRKADEFIAKFREQIRLQRVASARKLNHR